MGLHEQCGLHNSHYEKLAHVLVVKLEKRILKILFLILFNMFAQNIDCGQGGSNEYPQSMF